MDSGWKYAAASVIGTSHQSSPEGVCQDSHAFRYLEHASAFVGVVSDGAGSASRSQTGSRSTCDFVLEKIAEAPASSLFEESFAGETLERLRTGLQALADDAGLRIREFACTLLVAIVCPYRAVFWQIGDGAMCFREREEERYGYAFWPEKGDYANVTYFVTDANAKEHLDIDIAEAEIVELGIFSDGLERLALDFTSGEAHTGFFSGLFPHLRGLPEGHSEELAVQIADFLSSERVNKRTDDDKTLILASRAV